METSRRKEIESLLNDKQPGLKNYYMRIVADEIIQHIAKESLDGACLLNTKEIKDEYELSKAELLKVMVYLKNDHLHLSKFHINYLSYTIDTKLNLENYEELPVKIEQSLYDEEVYGIRLIGRTWLHNLVFSVNQASKIYHDIMFLAKEYYEQKNYDKVIQNYMEDRKELDQNVKASASDDNEVGIEKDVSPFLLKKPSHVKTFYEQFLNRNDEGNKFIYNAIREWTEQLKQEQIKDSLENQLEEFIDIENIQNEDWYDSDNALYNVKHNLMQRIPNYEELDRLQEDNLAMMNQVSLEEINRQYQIISPEKELEKGGFLK